MQNNYYGENYYQNILASIPDAIAVVSKELLVSIVNDPMEEMTGISSSICLNQPVSTLFSEKSGILDLISKTLIDSTTHSIHDYTYLRTTDRKSLRISLTISPLLTNNGELEGVIIIGRDQERLHELEDGLLRAEKLSMAGTLAAGMAHEIKNPIAGIRGSAQLLLDELQDDQYEEYVQLIIKESDRVNSIVEALLGITKVGAIKEKEVNIHKILDAMTALNVQELKKREITVTKRYDPSLPPIKGDPNQLSQVILNLIKNSMESIDHAGNITLTSRIAYNYSIVKGKKKKIQMVSVHIIDTGEGVAESIKSTLFTPFATTKQKGNGLGLALSYKIIEQHGGKITLKNREDNTSGAEAKILLPLPS